MGSTVAKRSENTGRRAIRSKTHGASLGITAGNMGELISHVEQGFSFKSLRKLESQSGISIATIASVIGIPERTLARRKAAGKLSPPESERLLRVSAVFEKAVDLFEGDVDAAVNWLTTSHKAVGHNTPLAYARSEVGAREVEYLIGRLEHGIFSWRSSPGE